VPEGSPAAVRPAVAAGSAVLFAITAAHVAGETARDALFLRALPPERLPWAYLGIAAGVLLGAQAVERAGAARARRAALRALLALAAAGYLAFAALESAAPAFLYAFYVWCGVATTLLVIQLWLLLGEALDVRAAKRAFAWISAGGLAGAAAGGGVSALLLLRVPVRGLLVAAAAALAVAALATLRLPAPGEADVDDAPRSASAAWRAALREAYGARVVAAVALLAATTLGIDWLFKAAAAEALPDERLGSFFARFHAAVNAGALALQLAVTPWLLERAGVARSLLVLPGLAAAGAALVAAVGGLAPALALKASEGALQHSLHRAGSEILFLPVPEPLRAGLRSAAAALGQRGGQLAGSLALLAALAAGAGPTAVAAGTALAAAALFALLLRLRRRYVDRFRTELRALAERPPAEMPPFDLAALESLLGALASSAPDDVIAALDLFESYGKAHLVPPLVLYHPDPRVLVRALELFRDARGAAVEPLVARLAAHADEDVRAAALRCRGGSFATGALRRLLYADPSPAVRGAALAELSRRRAIEPARERAVLDALLADRSGDLPSLARAIASLPAAQGSEWLEALARDPDAETRLALAEELARRPAPAHVPALLALLADPDAREPARRALCAIGAPALDALAAALRDARAPRAARRHVPRSLSRFPAERAMPLLVDALARERDPHVAHKILRGLGRLRADAPGVPLDVGPVVASAEGSLRRAVDLVALQAALAPIEAAHALLARLLREEEARAIERVFRALHIVDPALGYRALHDAVRGEDARAAAAAREVLEHVVKEPLRSGLLPLVAPEPARARLEAARGFHAPRGAGALLASDAPRGAEALWSALEADPDAVVAAVAQWTRAAHRPALRAARRRAAGAPETERRG